MAKCYVCGKGTAVGMQISHSNIHTKRTFKPNLQRVRAVLENGQRKRILVCTRCLRSGKVKRAI